MDMIRHQAVAKEQKWVPFFVEPQAVKVFTEIPGIQEYILPLITSRDNMIASLFQ
jgi:hypothetical protein